MLDARQYAMLNQMYNPKFLATADLSGEPNLAIVTSFEYYRGRLIFGNLFLWKTARNLAENPRVAVMVIDTELNYYIIEGTFTGFEDQGELIDHLNRSEMVRYNAYTGFRSAGEVLVTAVTPVQKLSPLTVLSGYLALNLRRSDPPSFPRAVADKFSALKSLKVAAHYSDNQLHLVPLPAAAVSGGLIRSTAKLPPGVRCAANVITPAVVSFQIKGTVEEEGLMVEQIFAAGLPVPGKLIYPLEAAGRSDG
jgi:hypothetical protein